MMSAVKHNGSRRVPIPLLAVALACGLLGACNLDLGKRNTTPVGSKGLWIANGKTVIEYNPSDLNNGVGATVPNFTLSSSAFGNPQGVTFDAAGNLWVTDPAGIVNGAATPAIFGFSVSQLAALGTNSAPIPVVAITSSSLEFPDQSVFDEAGNLWITDHTNNTVVVFAASQLATQGVTTNANPALIITSADFNGPLGIAFDSSGDLWVANNGLVPDTTGTSSSAGTTIVEILAANVPALPESGFLNQSDLTPDVTLSDDGQASIQAPWALRFDSSGNLWSSNSNAPSTLVEFAKADLGATGSPVPAVIISPGTESGDATLDSPHGMCFDDIGNVAAVSSAGAFGLAYYAQSQLTTGSPTPATFIVGSATTLDAPNGCTFGSVVTN
jgi:hypothetical protein